MRRSLLLVMVVAGMKLYAQDAPEPVLLKQILERLDSLEQENKKLVDEVHSLRERLDATAAAKPSEQAPVRATNGEEDKPTIDERVDRVERRTEEQAQTKVEAAHKFPIRLNGMLLFNAFANGQYDSTKQIGEYGPLTGPNSSGATMRQTLLGLDFDGPRLPGNGHVSGALMMDFWGGTSDPQLSWLRLRTADVTLGWDRRSVSFRLDKPLISPYQPDSLAQVGVPPLASSGNLWLWLPQVRYEERMKVTNSSGFTGQLAVMQTKETAAVLPPSVQGELEPTRPAIEGRVAFWHRMDDSRRYEFGGGFHASTTHFSDTSVPSRIGTADWLYIPWAHLRLSGAFFGGQNIAPLGGLGNGFGFSSTRGIVPMNGLGGWTQVAIPINARLTWNFYGGIENDYGATGIPVYTARSLSYATNLMYHLGPNVILSAEASQTRLRTFSGRPDLLHHYDVAIGYLF